MASKLWLNATTGKYYSGEFGTVPIGEEEAQDLGAELLDDELDACGQDGNAGCYDGLEFIGDVGRDPLGSIVND